MKKLKVILDFVRYAIAEKIEFYRNIVARLTDNPFFPNPDESLADVKQAVDKLEAEFLASRDGGHTAIASMRSYEKVVDRLFHNLAAYVDRIANGDEVKILSSGFYLTKQPELPDKPELSVTDGAKSGCAKLNAKALANGGAYIWQIANDTLPLTEDGWTIVGYSTSANYEVTGLTAGSTNYFRIAIITTAGVTDYSAPVKKLII